MKKLVVYGIGCGLGNRLLTSASGLAYAKKTDRKFEMIWHTGGNRRQRKLSHCNCKFENLFDNDFKLTDVDDYKFYIKNSECDYEDFATEHFWKRRWRKKNIEYTDKKHDVEFFNVDCTYNVNPPVSGCEGIGVDMNTTNKGVHDYIIELRDALNELEVKSEILDRVQSFSRDVVGVHIRRADFVKLGDAPWSMRQKIELSVFDKIIRNEISKGNLVYLCSDEGGVKKTFKEKYGEDVFVYDFGYGESYKTTSSEGGIRDALVEMLTLRKTKKIIHTNQSSFSYLSALWGDVELIGALDYKTFNTYKESL